MPATTRSGSAWESAIARTWEVQGLGGKLQVGAEGRFLMPSSSRQDRPPSRLTNRAEGSLCPRVDSPVGRRDGDGGDPGVSDAGELFPRPSSVLALEDTLVRGADVEGVWIFGVQRQAPGAAPFQPGLDPTVLYHGHSISSCHVQSYHG